MIMYDPKKFIEARLKIGKTQSEIAKMTGLDQSQISNVEKGKKKKPYEELFDFYEGYEIPKDFFLLDDSKNESEWKKRYEESRKEVANLKDELLQVRRDLSDIKDRFIAFQEMAFQKMNNMELGKAKASSKTATLSKQDDLSLYSLNFGR